MDGLIYVAIIALWAVFLVGQLLRHHDDAAGSKSADRFSTAMRVLARRSAPAPDKRYIVRPPVPTVPNKLGRETFVKGRPPPTPSRVRMLARRRRVLLCLLLLITATGVASCLDLVAVWWIIFPIGLFAMYAGYLRSQVRQATAARRRQLAVARSAAARRSRMERLERLRAARKGRDAKQAGVRVLDGHPVDDRADSHDRTHSGWAPRPWPLPTYVSAPPAPPPTRSTRVIDLTSPGAWSQGLAPERIEVREEPVKDLPEEEPGKIAPRRHVVND
jgi:hypothetical protein